MLINYMFNKRKGAFIAFFPMLMVVMLAMGGAIVDLSFARAANNQLQTATDAAALAGANALSDGNEEAINAATASFEENTILGHRANNINIELGFWNKETRTFSSGTDPANAVRITADTDPPAYFVPLLREIFARNTDAGSTVVSSSSIATGGSSKRDIIFVVDAGRNMNAFTSYRHRPDVPSGVSIYMAPIGHLDYPCCYPRNTPLDFALGVRIDFHPLLGRISNTSSIFATYPGSFSNTTIKSLMKWTDGPNYLPYKSGGQAWVAPYPYPVGAWNDYISYVKTNYYVYLASDRNKYFTRTWDSYLADMRPTFAESPRLWLSPSMQPWGSTRVAIRDFIANHLTDSDNHVGLILFNGATLDSAVLEQQLAVDSGSDIDRILHGLKTANPVPGNGSLTFYTAILPGRQPAHYSFTSIMYPGLGMAIDELTSDRAQPGAQKIIFLFSSADFESIITTPSMGIIVSNSMDTLQPEIDRAIANNIKIHTISYEHLGQPDLLQTRVAEPTGGQSFIVPYPAADRSSGASYLFSDVLAGWLEDESAQLVQ